MNKKYNIIIYFSIIISGVYSQDAYMNISHQGLQPNSTITVEAGEEITFEHGGGGPHPMTSGQGSTPSPIYFPTVTVTSGNPIAVFTLDDIGTYLFHCGTNPGNTSNWGTIIVESGEESFPTGDVDLDSTLTQADAEFTFQYLMGSMLLNENQQFEADVSLDGSVSVLDVSLLSMAVDSLIEIPYPNEDGILIGNSDIYFGEIEYVDELIYIPLEMSNNYNALAFNISVFFDFEILSLEDVLIESSLGENLEGNNIDDGNLQILSSLIEPLTDVNQFGKLVFSRNEGSTESSTVILEKYQINEESYNYSNEEIEIDALGINTKKIIPENVIISNVYPNPFNPVTEVSISLGIPSMVKMNIIDINGRLIKELAEGYFSSGINRFKWDGKDNSGYQVMSGIYFVMISSDFGYQTKKITLLK